MEFPNAVLAADQSVITAEAREGLITTLTDFLGADISLTASTAVCPR